MDLFLFLVRFALTALCLLPPQLPLAPLPPDAHMTLVLQAHLGEFSDLDGLFGDLDPMDRSLASPSRELDSFLLWTQPSGSLVHEAPVWPIEAPSPVRAALSTLSGAGGSCSNSSVSGGGGSSATSGPTQSRKRARENAAADDSSSCSSGAVSQATPVAAPGSPLARPQPSAFTSPSSPSSPTTPAPSTGAGSPDAASAKRHLAEWTNFVLRGMKPQVFEGGRVSQAKVRSWVSTLGSRQHLSSLAAGGDPVAVAAKTLLGDRVEAKHVLCTLYADVADAARAMVGGVYTAADFFKPLGFPSVPVRNKLTKELASKMLLAACRERPDVVERAFAKY